MFEKKKITVNPEVDITGFTFVKAAEAIGKEGLVCWGHLIYNSKFGEGVALVANDGCLYNLPSRYVADFKSCTDEENEFVMSGKKLEFREYETKAGQKTVIASIDGKDI